MHHANPKIDHFACLVSGSKFGYVCIKTNIVICSGGAFIT